jgi:hypothetical protein
MDAQNSAIYIKTTNTGTTGRTSIDFEDNTGNVFEYGIRNSGETPYGRYWYSGGAYRMSLTNSGRLGIGTTSPRAPLEVTATNTSFTQINIATNTFSYDVSTNSWANRGGGPFTLTNIAAWFAGNIYIYISNGLWAISDRRLKKILNQLIWILSVINF